MMEQRKDCDTCAHEAKLGIENPCRDCWKGDAWEPADEGGLEKVIDWKSIDDDGLPPAGIPLLVTVDRGNTGGPRRVVIGPVYYMKTSFGGQWRFCEHGNEEHAIGPEFIAVTAWSEWPAPYTGGSR